MIVLGFPRPDFYRAKWISLEGPWSFTLDDSESMNIDMASNLDSYAYEIRVPFSYQSKNSEIKDKFEHDVVWYAKRFRVPLSLIEDSRTVLLWFGAVDYEANVWFNGKFLGSHVGGYDSFFFDVTSLIGEENQVVLRVVDRHGDQPRGKQVGKDQRPEGILYSRVTGIWQPVWLEFIKGSAYVKRYFAYPRVDGEVGFRVELAGTISGRQTLEFVVFYGGSVVARKKFKVKGQVVEDKIKLDSPYLWSPNDPNLYDLQLRLLENDGFLDDVHGYFGIREIKPKGDKLLLNGETIYLQLVLDQGYYADGIYTPSDVKQFLWDLQAVLNLGFNGVRAHQKPPDPRYLYVADSLGVLLWEEMADWGMALKKENFENFASQWRNVVLRDFNHPCVIVWVPLNERGEASSDVEARDFVSSVYRLTKSLDSTRLVIDTSGWTHVKTDLLDVHDYLLCMDTGKSYSVTLSDKGIWQPIIEGKQEVTSNGLRISIPEAYKEQPIIVSEFGGWGINGQKPIIDRKPYVYAKMPDSFRLEMKYKDTIYAIASSPYITGYCYTQLYDVEGELNGLLTYDRKYKVNPQKIRLANVNALKIHMQPRSTVS